MKSISRNIIITKYELIIIILHHIRKLMLARNIFRLS